MKGDFSRDTFRPANRYTSVRMQQGRVLLDSDWNEQAAIREHSERERFAELVGDDGVAAEGGIAIRAGRDGVPELTPGRAYAGGLACVLDEATPLAELLTEPSTPAAGRTDLVYLDAWERHLTALDEPSLLDPALGGPDTTTRLRVAWRPVLIEDVGHPTCEEIDRLVASPAVGGMRASAPGGYSGADNHLYRVEIHQGGDLGAASFKWSRDNGSVAFAVAEFVGRDTLRLAPGFEPQRMPGDGDWLEVAGGATEGSGRAGTVARVDSARDGGTIVSLDRPVDRHRDELRPHARLWDAAELTTISERIALESGIGVSFSGGGFRTGDYWTIPARPADASAVEWPEGPPQGPERGSCPLALVTWDGASAVVRDCRRLFSPLTEVRRELARLAAEVTELRRRLEG